MRLGVRSHPPASAGSDSGDGGIEGYPAGREREGRLLSAAWDAAASGTRQAVVLAGEPGVGKTRLLRWLAARATDAGAVCAAARAPASAGLPPGFPLGDLVDGLRRSCGRAGVDEPDSLIDLDLRLAKDGYLDAGGVLPLAACVNDLTARAPVGLFVDDAQWVSPEALDAITGLLHLCDGALLVAVTTRARGRDSRAVLDELPGDVARLVIPVEPMDAGGIAAMAEASLGAPLIPSAAAALHEASRGLPLAAGEIIRAWLGAGTLLREGGYLVPVEPATPPHDDLFAGRINRLEPGARRVVEIMAVLGTTAPFEHVREILEADAVALGETLADLADAGIVASADGALAYSLAHPVYESAVLRLLGPTRIASLHLAAYRGLRRLRAGGVAVAASILAHHGTGAIAPPPDLHDLLLEAASSTEGGNAREHARWLGELERIEAPGRGRDLTGLRRATAILSFDAAAARDAFESLAVRAADPGIRARCLAGLAKAERRLGRMDRAVAQAGRAATLAPGDGETLGTLALMLGVSGNLAGAEETLERAVRIDPASAGPLANHRAMVAFLRGRLDEAVAIAEAHAAEADPEHLGNLLSNLAWFRAIDGRLGDAAALLGRSLEVAGRGSALFAALSAHCDLAIVHAWGGAHAEALDHAVQAERLLRLTGDEPGCRFDVLDAFGVVYLEAGDPAAALDRLRGAIEISHGGAGPYEQAFTLASYADAQRATGDPLAALDTLDRAEAGPVVPPCWGVRLTRVRAACLLDAARPREAIEVLATLAGATRPAMDLAVARLVLAGALRAVGRRADAAAAATDAAEAFRAIGASRRLREAAAMASALSRGRGRPRSESFAGLTPREQDIVRLVRDALTNRQIAASLGISERTVEKHLANASMKLGVRRRGQVASIATARGL